MKSKHTKGEIKVSYSDEFSNDYYISPTPTFGQREANAKLIEEAFNVTNETGLTPRELQKSHAELLEALRTCSRVLSTYASGQSIDAWYLAEKAINNAKPNINEK